MEIKEIKNRLSILSVLASYNLKPNKNNLINCPFHNDKTASLQIYSRTNSFYCFACGAPEPGSPTSAYSIPALRPVRINTERRPRGFLSGSAAETDHARPRRRPLLRPGCPPVRPRHAAGERRGAGRGARPRDATDRSSARRGRGVGTGGRGADRPGDNGRRRLARHARPRPGRPRPRRGRRRRGSAPVPRRRGRRGRDRRRLPPPAGSGRRSPGGRAGARAGRRARDPGVRPRAPAGTRPRRGRARDRDGVAVPDAGGARGRVRRHRARPADRRSRLRLHGGGSQTGSVNGSRPDGRKSEPELVARATSN